MDYHTSKMPVYEDEVMKLGAEIEALKRLIAYYGDQPWLSYESQQNLNMATTRLPVLRKRMKQLVSRAQMRLF